MVIKNIDFEKYNKMAEKSFYRKLGKVVNVVGNIYSLANRTLIHSQERHRK